MRNLVHVVPLLLMICPGAVSGQEQSYGEALYENHCTGCHESTLHLRDDRKATDLKQIEGQVRRWADYQNLDWQAEQVDAVRDYVNQTYYGFFDEAPSPPGLP